jgi:glutamate--cysteine ligase
MTRDALLSGAKIKRLLYGQIQKNRHQLLEWQRVISSKYAPPFYCSVDLRDSGYKIAPVDSNLYPAGFNNICPNDIRSTSSVMRSYLEKFANERRSSVPKRILIVPEAHTANKYYIENLYYLIQILTSAGFEIRLGWYGTQPKEMPHEIRLVSATGKELTASSLQVTEGILHTEDFVPDLILLNNDFSSGYPGLLDAVRQPILPSHVLGWHSRRKSEHFTYYNNLAAEFASIIGIDPWIIQIETRAVGPVNFNEEQGVEQVAKQAEQILAKTHADYQQRQIQQKPFVFVKNNAGTYGMGIMVVHEADELRHMNRRTKNKMSVGKNHLPIQSVVIQEGVPTATLVDRLAAEPVIYLVGQELIGGFLRTNSAKGTEDNLNAPGMVFKKLCMSDLKHPSLTGVYASDEEGDEEPILELVYGSIARISALATGMELAAHIQAQQQRRQDLAPTL